MVFIYSFFIINFRYIVRVVVLRMLVFLITVVILRGAIYLKFLIIIIYVSGIVVFMMYMSCLCWEKKRRKGGYILLAWVCFIYFIVDHGLRLITIIDGGRLRVYLFSGFLFSSLVMVYSLILFRRRGSLRF